jgi:hypothetical protein
MRGSFIEDWDWGAFDAEDYVLSVDFYATRTLSATRFTVK